MPDPKSPDREQDKPLEPTPGGQQDDNIDDLGRPVNDPHGKPMDQPIVGDESDKHS
jgi:hypothetical protein